MHNNDLVRVPLTPHSPEERESERAAQRTRFLVFILISLFLGLARLFSPFCFSALSLDLDFRVVGTAGSLRAATAAAARAAAPAAARAATTSATASCPATRPATSRPATSPATTPATRPGTRPRSAACSAATRIRTDLLVCGGLACKTICRCRVRSCRCRNRRPCCCFNSVGVHVSPSHRRAASLLTSTAPEHRAANSTTPAAPSGDGAWSGVSCAHESLA